VVLTERAKNSLEIKGSLPCYVIPNPVLVSPAMGEKPTELLHGKRVVAMGRLTEQKGFDILLDAFGRARARFPDWSLFIIGEGPLRPVLEARSQQPDLKGSVTFAGRLDTPSSMLGVSQLFVLSSRYEGFPNALTEAMAMGLPVISTDCPTGPREIIQNGINGLLVPPEDPNALATAMERLMSDPDERTRLGHAAEHIIERYSLERIMGQWEVLLSGVQTDRRLI
jgi:glycosyltransferase involved in cell wall biosynthesis